MNPLPTDPILDAADYAAFAGLLRGSDCRRCALAAGRAHIVVDRGDPAAGIVAVGEAPGEQEDREGRAFVGRAGRLLDELLRGAGLDPDATLARARSPELAARLDADTREAVERGVFGVPTVFVGDEMFWGNDRFEVARHYVLKAR